MAEEKKFLNGIIVKSVETKYGELIKLSINKDKIAENPFNEKGWINAVLKKSQSGNYYIEIDTWKPDITNAKDVNVEEIPF